MLEQCRSFQNKPDKYNATYFTFPRYLNERLLGTWPATSPRLVAFFAHVLDRCRSLGTLTRERKVRNFVVACQCLIIASFTISHDTKYIKDPFVQSNFVKIGEEIAARATNLFDEYNDLLCIKEVTDKLLAKLPSNFKELKYILFTDEASSLLSPDPFSKIHQYFNIGEDSSDDQFGCDWNLFRCYRHAARNLRYSTLKLMIVVAGTHTSLSNFSHDVQKEEWYRPGRRYVFSLKPVHIGLTIPPVSNGAIQIFSDFKFKSDISLLLSLENALSCRPLWVSCMKLTESITDDDILEEFLSLLKTKVDASFGITNLQAEVAAFLTIMLPGVAMHESLLTKFVQYSLAIVEFSTVKSNDGVELSCSYLRPSVDPLVAHFAWKRF
ncbi:hypothetical protein GEMRC1_008628 [Eukaryota sp. GEM-RC1]